MRNDLEQTPERSRDTGSLGCVVLLKYSCDKCEWFLYVKHLCCIRVSVTVKDVCEM